MILFKILRWKNFLSTGNVFTELKMDRSPNTLVVGTNGAGKSTMLDALTFALFGKPYRNINKPTLINSINNKDCVVEVEFRTQNKNYKIVRGIKPTKFEIYADGELINQEAASKDYQEVLEEQILKFNYKSFTQIAIIGSSSFIPFMQLSAADRRTIIEDLLDINIFSSMNTVVKDKASQLKTRSSEIKIKIDGTMSKIEMQKKFIADAQKNNKDLIEQKQKEYNEQLDSVKKLQKDSTLIQKHIDLLLKKVADEKAVKDKQKKLGQLETKIETNLSKVEADKQFFEDNDDCPTCKQVIEKKAKAAAIKDGEKKIKTMNEGLDKLKEEYDATSLRLTEIAKIHKNITEHTTEIAKINASILQIQKYAKKLEKEIQELDGKKVLSEDMLSVSKELVEELQQLNEERKSLGDQKIYVDASAALLKDTGIKSRIVKQYLPVINKLLNKYLSAMDFFVNFEINEEFKETIKSRYRDEFSYENFSEGEKMRIDLAILFTWRAIAKMKNSMNTNILIMDEVFDSSLDNNGTDEFMKLIQTLNETNVFVISHKGDILVDKFRSVIKFDKVKNFSRIV
jgi:DNA repair exonuclease SbcCD ATPase subunit